MTPPAAAAAQAALTSTWYTTLTAFVAVNTLIYVVLAVAKMLPRMHPTGWLRRAPGSTRRRESRSIYPEGGEAGR